MSGRVHIYTGDGKGKTTACMGLALRAVGAGKRVFIGQFIKGKPSAEVRVLMERCPEVTAEQFGSGCFIRKAPTQEDLDGARCGINRLREVLSGGEYDMVIVDEALGALRAGLFCVDDLLELIDSASPMVEVVLSGRNAPPVLVERADLVTEMRKVKHYYDAGVEAREGIEF